MKGLVLLLCSITLLGACATDKALYKMQTIRQMPYYLTTQATQVQDTCPGQDILKQYICPHDQLNGLTCFDVYMVQGSPAPEQRYSLLQEKVENQPVSAQPVCPDMQPTCESFLKALKYNLEFSWYLVNFPSSSFKECRETYDCKRIDCYIPQNTQADALQSTLVSCVFKRNQLFFVGSQVTCQRTMQ